LIKGCFGSSVQVGVWFAVDLTSGCLL